eukprot:5821927-Pyramimonas_sp.AAC.1
MARKRGPGRRELPGAAAPQAWAPPPPTTGARAARAPATRGALAWRPGPIPTGIVGREMARDQKRLDRPC